MKARILLSLLFLPVCLSLFLSCGKDNKITLTVLGENSSNLQAMEALKAKYEINEGITIAFKPNTFEDAFNKANSDFANKTGLYDIVLQYNFSLSSFVRNEYVFPIGDLTRDVLSGSLDFEKQLFQNAWREVGFYYKYPSNPAAGSQKIGYPFASNTMLLVYNKSMFEDPEAASSYKEKYGEDLTAPETWEQFHNIAEFFTQKGQGTDGNTYGVCLQGAEGGWLYYEFCTFLYGMGGKVMDKERGWEGTINTPITLLSDEAIRATEFYKGLRPFNAGNYFTIDAAAQIQILKEGNVAMGFVWSDYLYNFVYDSKGRIDERFAFAPLPGDKSPIAGGCFYINRQSKHPNAAAKYIINLMQPANQIELAQKGLCSPLESTYDDPAVKKIPYSEALRLSLHRGVYMYEAGPDSDLISQIITKHIQQLWNDKVQAEKALSDAQDEIVSERAEVFRSL